MFQKMKNDDINKIYKKTLIILETIRSKKRRILEKLTPEEIKIL